MNLNPLFVSFLFFHLATLWCIYNTLRSIGLIPQILNCNMHHTCHLFLQMILTHLKVISIKSIRSLATLLVYQMDTIVWGLHQLNSTKLDCSISSIQSWSILIVDLFTILQKKSWNEKSKTHTSTEVNSPNTTMVDWNGVTQSQSFILVSLFLHSIDYRSVLLFYLFIYLVTLSTYYGL